MVIFYTDYDQCVAIDMDEHTWLAIKVLLRALRARTGSQIALLQLLAQTENAEGISAMQLLTTGRYDEAEALLRPIIFSADTQEVQHSRMIRWSGGEE